MKLNHHHHITNTWAAGIGLQFLRFCQFFIYFFNFSILLHMSPRFCLYIKTDINSKRKRARWSIIFRITKLVWNEAIKSVRTTMAMNAMTLVNWRNFFADRKTNARKLRKVATTISAVRLLAGASAPLCATLKVVRSTNGTKINKVHNLGWQRIGQKFPWWWREQKVHTFSTYLYLYVL